MVSVVIPCYNQAHFLGEAIESVLAQTYAPVEIVVVDDGSPDDTAAVAARYPGVRCVRQDNQGRSAARNTGLRQSGGDYLVFLDADDRLLPDALASGLACLAAHPDAAFACGRCTLIAADGTPLPNAQLPYLESEAYAALLQQCFIWNPAAVLYRRGVFESVGGFDTSPEPCEDYDLYLRVAREFPIHCHNGIVAEYRQHGANTTRNPALMLTTALRVLRAQREHLRGNKRYQAAYRAGVEYYGQRLAVQVRIQLAARAWRPALGSALTLLRYHPGLFVRAARRLPAYGRGRLRSGRRRPAELGASGTRSALAHPPEDAPSVTIADATRADRVALVSVVIPCYNQAHFLGEAIESVLAQTYAPVEIVVVDDGSPDDTAAVAARYPGVRCVRQDNQGLAAARNTGLRQSGGDYLVFLDADDRLLPDALASGLACLAAHPDAAFACGRCTLIAADGTPIPIQYAQPPYIASEPYVALLHQCFIWNPATVFYRRSVFESVGGFDPAVNPTADYDLYLRVARAFPIHCHNGIVAEYRQHGTNMTRNSALMLTATLRVLRSQREHLRGNKRYEEAYRTGVAQCREYYCQGLVVQVRVQLVARVWRPALGSALTLLRYHPRLFVRACRRLPAYVGGRLRSGQRRQA